MKGARVTLLEYAPRKSTVEVKVGKMRLALRKEESDMIEVEYEAK
jgi:ferrous iron transport protein A